MKQAHLILIAGSIILLIGIVKGEYSDSPFKFETLNTNNTQIQLNFSKSKTTFTQIYQFYNNHPRDLMIQLQEGKHSSSDNTNSNNSSNGQQKEYEITIYIYEYPSQKECEIGLQERGQNLVYNEENLFAQLQSSSHPLDHVHFIEDYFYLIHAVFTLHNIQTNPGDMETPPDGDPSANQHDSKEYYSLLVLKFLADIPSCEKSGNYDEIEGRCVCYKNKFGRFCEYDVQQITNYYPFEVQLKPFDGKYLQIYKISLEDEIKLEMVIKKSVNPNIYIYRSDNSIWYPTQYLYFEKLVFNSTNNHNVIPADPTDSSIILFIRNPSNQSLSVTLNVKNVTLIDDTNIVFFIMISLVVTLAVSFLCIFCFNKISNGTKRHPSKHVELHDTKESDNKDLRQNNIQNGTTPQTNRNLIDEIKTQRENQIKSEMDQITKGDTYEQFQLENSFKEQICAICLDDFEYDDVVRKTKCNHMFHEKCLYKWLFKYISCPMCNQDLT